MLAEEENFSVVSETLTTATTLEARLQKNK